MALDIHFEQSQRDLNNKNNWLNFNKTNFNNFNPFVEKKIVTPENRVIFKGDMHGDIHSLVSFLKKLQLDQILEKNSFKIINPNFHIIFLGDYTDRGVYGTEVIYTILRLKIENPEQVTLVRGNHEDLMLNSRYGFCHEFDQKFNIDPIDSNLKSNCLDKINRFYNLLPAAIYLGSGKAVKSFLLCCHGGLEVGFNASLLLNSKDQIKYQSIDKLYRKQEAEKLTDCFKYENEFKNFKRLCKDFIPKSPVDLGFLWSDFIVDSNYTIGFNPGRGFAFGKDISYGIINLSNLYKNKLKGVFRAHQHVCSNSDELMMLMIENNGIASLWNNKVNNKVININKSKKSQEFNLWDGIVCTFLLSPDGDRCKANRSFIGFDFDTWAILKTEEEFNNWQLKVINNNIF